MRLDDLLGDRQSQAGILAETLMRPVGVEALENPLERVRTDPGAVVVDDDLDAVSQSSAQNAHGAARRRERAGVLDQIVDDLTEAGIVPEHGERARAATLEAESDRHSRLGGRYRSREYDVTGISFALKLQFL